MMPLLALSLALGCGGPAERAPVDLSPTPADGHDCGVCGMVVTEQPAPRAQVVHRGGERVYLCSIADLRAYLQSPSRRGPPAAVWVEALRDGDPLTRDDTAPRGWVSPETLTWVVGFERPGVMGRPALGFSDASVAEATRAVLGARSATWQQLLETPFDRDPQEE